MTQPFFLLCDRIDTVLRINLTACFFVILLLKRFDKYISVKNLSTFRLQ